jgi:hypothetical protein
MWKVSANNHWVLTLKLFISPIHWMRCLPSSIFLFLQCANLIVLSLKKKNKLWKHPKIEGLILKFRVPFLWPIYMWKEDKSGVLLGKWTVDSPLSTPNTTWKKKPTFPSYPQRKKTETPSLHDMTSHCLHGNYIPTSCQEPYRVFSFFHSLILSSPSAS